MAFKNSLTGKMLSTNRGDLSHPSFGPRHMYYDEGQTTVKVDDNFKLEDLNIDNMRTSKVIMASGTGTQWGIRDTSVDTDTGNYYLGQLQTWGYQHAYTLPNQSSTKYWYPEENGLSGFGNSIQISNGYLIVTCPRYRSPVNNWSNSYTWPNNGRVFIIPLDELPDCKSVISTSRSTSIWPTSSSSNSNVLELGSGAGYDEGGPHPNEPGSSGYTTVGFGESMVAGSGRIAVGDPCDGNGKIHVYDMAGRFHYTLTSPNTYGSFGLSMATSNGKLLTSDLDRRVNYPKGTADHGKVYVYDIITGSLENIYDPYGNFSAQRIQHGRFGQTMAAADGMVVVGAPWADAGKGMAFLFNIENGPNHASSNSIYNYIMLDHSKANRNLSDVPAETSYGGALGIGCGRVAVGAKPGYNGSWAKVDLYNYHGHFIKTITDAGGFYGSNICIKDSMIIITSQDYVYIYDLDGNKITSLYGKDTKWNDIANISSHWDWVNQYYTRTNRLWSPAWGGLWNSDFDNIRNYGQTGQVAISNGIIAITSCQYYYYANNYNSGDIDRGSAPRTIKFFRYKEGFSEYTHNYVNRGQIR